RTFIVDNTKPTAAITQPNYIYTNYLSNISGTAYDPQRTELPEAYVYGMDKVYVRVVDAGAGTYFNGTGFVSGVQEILANNDSINANVLNWSTSTLLNNSLLDGKNYKIFVRAVDKAGNYEATENNLPNFEIVYDTTTPYSYISTPTNLAILNSLSYIGGTAYDPNGTNGPLKSDLKQVEVQIYDEVGAKWWYDGDGGFSVLGSSFNIVNGTDTWSYTHPNLVSALISNRYYILNSRAKDRAGNTQNGFVVGQSSITFIWDKTPPVSTIIFPVSSGTYKPSDISGPNAFNGTATDTNLPFVGIQLEKVELNLSYLDGNATYYWLSSAFSSNTTETASWFTAIGTSTWRYPFDGASNFISDKEYSLKVRATDKAKPSGNVENPPKEIKFIVDGTPPNSNITTPTANGYMTNINSISGNSYGGLSGLQDLKLRIYYYEGADVYYWDGNSNWLLNTVTDLPVDFAVSKDTITWSYPPVGYNPPAILINNKEYWMGIYGTDKAGNVETLKTIKVTSDFNYPTIVISTPMSGSNAFYGTNRTINPINGQGADTPAGIVPPIKIQITNVSESGAVKPKWDGNIWSVVDSTYVGVNNINPWDYSVSNWVNNKKYRLDVWSVDYAGNQTPDGAYRRFFIYDVNKPSSSITSFNSGFRKLIDISTITGNSIDWVLNASTESMSGIKPNGIFIQIADNSGKTFNGSGFVSGDNWRAVSTVSVVGVADANIGATIYSSMTWRYPGNTGDLWPATLELSEGTTYYVRVRAVDRSENLENYIEKSFIYDNTPPTVGVSTPSDAKAYTSLPYISGTVSEPISYLPSDGVQVLIQRDADGAYWNGTGWDGTYNYSSHWKNATEIYQSSWVYTDSNLSTYFNSLSGALRFKVFVRAKDIANNLNIPDTPAPSSGYNLFTIDKWAPVSITTYPALGNGSTFYYNYPINNIAGTANEYESGYPSGVGEVYVKIIRKDKNEVPCYYNLLNNDWVNTDQGWLNRNLGTVNDWIRTISDTAFKGSNTGNCYPSVDKGNGFRFEVISYAKDNTEPFFGGPNVETVYSTATFIIDYSTPIGTVNDNNTYFKTKTQISGTASDPEIGGEVISGLNNVVIDLKDMERNKYWNFNSLTWSDTYVSTAITSNLSNWLITALPLNDNSANSWSVGRGSATFELRARVNDKAGNYLDFNLNKSTFTLDIIIPTSTVTYPDVENGSFLPFAQITGTADDFTSGISTVQIRIQQDTTQGGDCVAPAYNGQYFNGNGFQSLELWLGVSSYNSGTKQWIYNIDPTKLNPLCYYIIKSSAADNVGNAQSVYGSRRFKFAPPPSFTSITQPPNNSYRKQISNIVGTANPDTKSVNVYIKRNSDSWWWNYSGSFTATKISTSVTPSGGAWTYSASLPNFVDGSSYTFISEGINFYNVPEASPLENIVFFDTTPPAVSITTPDGIKQYYNNISTFTGTATDPPGTTPPSAGINNVFVELKALNGDYQDKYWDNVLSTFTSSWSESNNIASYYAVTSTWSYSISVPTAALINGVKYSVRVKARDNSYKDAIFEGNDSAWFGPYNFNYDIITPTATISSVSNGQIRSDVSISSGNILEDLVLENISGYPSAQISEIRLFLKNNNQNQYWNGSGWSLDPNTYVSANIYQSSWSVSSMPFWTDNYTYTFYSKAYDKAGNIQNNFVVGSSSHTIRIDKLMPVVSVSSPAQSGIYSVFPTVYGTASDQNPNTASGINGASNIQVSVSYVDGGTTYYFDGASSFINTLNEYNSFFNATGWSASGPSSGTWTFEPAGLSSALVGNKIYRVRARAQDNAIPIPNPSDLMLNVATNYNIIYDTTPPVSMVTLPINGSTVNAVSIIAGSVSDNMAGVSDKSQILLSICEVQPAGMCWNGVVPGTFTVAGEVFYPLDNDASLNGSYS
ncbi:MAG TPA: Ig-like domain repeat protein, partial [Elusimicrobiales bacterium]|nr:Ig-like domain repeat protein [Elusimicrobiales bacterium]